MNSGSGGWCLTTPEEKGKKDKIREKKCNLVVGQRGLMLKCDIHMCK